MSAIGWQRQWQALTREGRDTLWLLGMLALVMAPHMPRLPLWCSLGAAAALLWRARLAWLGGTLPPRWLMLSLLVASVTLTWFTHRNLIGREPGITLVVILTTLKCLELRARRDSLVCLYLGFFLILTQFFYSQGLGTAALMLVGVWGLLTALVLGQRPTGRPPLMEVGRDAIRAMLWGLPLMLVLFVLFPRLGPLWSLPKDAQARTGLSDELSLGQVAELALDESIALRIRFVGRAPPPSQLYFRGPTLEQFDGQTWRPLMYRFNDADIQPIGPSIDYVITMEPSTLPFVPLLDGTLSAEVSGGAEITLRRTGLEWLRRGGNGARFQVEGRAWPQWREPEPGTNRQSMRRWLALPAGFNPRTLAWAQSLRQRPGLAGASAERLSDAVLGHIRQENYRYTLSPDLPAATDSRHLIDDFWIDRRQGFCEHFATSYVVVMRAMGVPARVVTGFQGAEYNPVDGQYVVRNSSAHAWAEIWSPDLGWQRVDPTAAVAPERVERPTTRARPFAGLPGPLGQFDPESLRRLRLMWDAVDHRWNIWVLQYSRGQQMALLRSLGWSSPDWQDLGRLLAWALAALGLGSSLVLWWTRERHPVNGWHRPLSRVHRALVAVSSQAPPGLVPAAASAWRASLAAQWSSQPAPDGLTTRQALLNALAQLDALRYGPPPTAPRARATLNAQVRLIERLARTLRDDAAHSGTAPKPQSP